MALMFAALSIAAIGHTVLWVSIVNRTHGLGVQRKWVKFSTLACVIAFAAIPLAVAAALVRPLWTQVPVSAVAAAIAWIYVALCVLALIASVVQRWNWAQHPERCNALASNHTTRLEIPLDSLSLAARGAPRLLSKLPGNQVFDIRIQEKELIIYRLPAALDGLRIAHVTDLHMSGRILRPFFEHVVAAVNRASADLVAITGDIVEGDQYLDWIGPTLGQLQARQGVYYVLGNHDRRATESSLKAALADAGLTHLGGACHQLTLNDAPLVLAGNELPWYGPATDFQRCPPPNSAIRTTRILLAHSPDQFQWAQKNDVDLMLAGHLHGGQVRLPVLGPFLAPSLCGVRYASGTFTSGHTTLHVSRGVSSLTPVRYGCPPEIAILVLRKADT
jgi:predicted MPP superfamily phosphohydrolase